MCLVGVQAFAQTRHNETVVWNFVNGLEIAGVAIAPGAGVTHTGPLTPNRFLLGNGVGDIKASESLTGLVLSNGASAPTAYSGTSCTNKVLTGLSAAGVGTCTTLTSAYVDSSILSSGSALPAANLTGTITPATQDLITWTGTLVSGATGSGFTLALDASTVDGDAGGCAAVSQCAAAQRVEYLDRA